MEEFSSSDCNNLTMLATKSFNQIIEQVQTSCLNFQIQISPFSALISLKKSLIKDQSGNPVLPTKHPLSSSELVDTLEMKNLELVRKLNTLTNEHAALINDYAEAKNTIKKLEDFKQNAGIKVEAASSEHVEKIEDELDELKKALKGRDDEIFQLQVAHNTSKAVSNKLNKVLEQNKFKYEKETSLLEKEHRFEIKAWKKRLGNEQKEKIKLVKKYEKALNDDENIVDEKKNEEIDNSEEIKHATSESEVICSICAEPILDFKPKYFLGEPFNPACNKCDDSFSGDNSGPDPDGCKHTPVCTVRQPHPPPLLAVTHLINEHSKYHEHMMSVSGVPGRYGGCDRCMSAYSKNYGCDDCVWLKWHGDLHGYPDIHPSDFKKYLEPSEWSVVSDLPFGF